MLQLALKNMKYYLKQYAVYLGTMAANAWIFFTYMILCNLPVIKELNENQTYGFLLRAGEWLIIGFALLFALYASASFIQKREREFGLYLLLGIKKSSVAELLMAENTAIGMGAVMAGLSLSLMTAGGVQRMMSLLVPEFPITAAMPGAAVFLTGILRYLLVFIIVTAAGIRRIYKKQIVELFKSAKMEEKKIESSPISGIGSMVLLALGYILIFHVKGAENLFLIPCGFTCVTVGVFWVCRQGISWVTDQIRNTSGNISDLSRMVSTAHIRHQIRKNSDSWSTVSLLLSIVMSLTILILVIRSGMMMAAEQMAVYETPEANAPVYAFAMLMFLTILLCINFIADAGSMMYFKTLSGIMEHQDNYEILYCLGADQHELQSILRRECRVIFVVPIFFGVFNTVMFAWYLKRLYLMHSVTPLLISLAVSASVYFVYYLLTYISVNNSLSHILCRRNAI